MASKGFFVLKYSGIGVAEDSALFQSVCCVLSFNEKKGSTSDECSLHED